MNSRKSDIDIDYFQIEGVNRMYGLESKGRKDINISKNYEKVSSASKDPSYQWDGTYTISYDGVTDLRCFIDIADDAIPRIDFIEGESIHGSASPYPLDYEYDKSKIDSIIMEAVSSDSFLKLCRECRGNKVANLNALEVNNRNDNSKVSGGLNSAINKAKKAAKDKILNHHAIKKINKGLDR